MIDIHIAKLRARSVITDEEEHALRSAVSEYQDLPRGTVVVEAGVVQECSTLLLQGFMCRFKDLQNGQRQLTELHVPGDFVDLHSFTLKYLDHSIVTLTPTRVGIVWHRSLDEITRAHPSLTRTYWFNTNLDAAIHREWELSLGRRSAIARVAMLLSELQVRLQIVGLADDSSYDLPLTQTDIGDCMGLTNISVNRVLRQLRERSVALFQNGRVTILDRDELWRIAEFDRGYLYLGNRNR